MTSPTIDLIIKKKHLSDDDMRVLEKWIRATKKLLAQKKRVKI